MTNYQPLAKVRQTLKVKWYRTKIDRNKMTRHPTVGEKGLAEQEKAG
jgi:hypothetical protein